jgi:ABC-type bacteriocin/lantibiotic exporter with double-glycine peptidase domain
LTREYLSARRSHYVRVLRQLAGGVLLQVLSMVALLGLGGWLVMRGELALGQLVAAELVVGLVASRFAKVGKYFETIYDLLASIDKVGKVVDLPRYGEAPVPSRGALGVELSGVRIGDGDVAVHGSVPPRARALVELEHADDASELLEALGGLRPLRGGDVQVHDQGRVLTDAALRERAMLIGTSDVVEGTIMSNLRLADPDLTAARALEVLELVKLDAVVRALPEGLDSHVHARGGPLSPSERRRLGLARALVDAPDLLLLDGSLDALGLDDEGTVEVLDALLGSSLDSTVLVWTRDSRVKERCGWVVRAGGGDDVE